MFQGFITDSGLVDPKRVQLIMTSLGHMEDRIFKDRQDRELQFKARNKAKRRRERQQAEARGPRFLPQGQFAPRVRFKKSCDLRGHVKPLMH